MEQSMTTYILLLRAINAGKLRKIKMDKLREVFAQLDFPFAKTYIQTGNVLFRWDAHGDRVALVHRLQKIMDAELGWSVPALIYSLDEWESIVNSNPFLQIPEYDPAFFQCALLQKKVDSPMKIFEFDDVKHTQGKRAVYSYCPDGYRNAKYKNNDIERKLNVVATTRNWNTMTKLLKLAKEYK
jgi:uncharacterized protein (DUF1697 family)